MVVIIQRTYGQLVARAVSAIAIFMSLCMGKVVVADTAVTNADVESVFRDAKNPSIERVLAGNCSSCYSEGAYYSQATYYSQSYYQGSYQTTFTKDVLEQQNFTVFGTISKGSGTFVIDHPLNPKNWLLYHSFVESPDAKNLYDGVATLDSKGEVRVLLPSYFTALNKEYRYQLKPIGESMPDLYIKAEVVDNRFTIGGGKPGGKVSWQVSGIRKDAYIEANPIEVEVEKDGTTLVQKGEYLHEGVYASSFLSPIGNWLKSAWNFLRGAGQ